MVKTCTWSLYLPRQTEAAESRLDDEVRRSYALYVNPIWVKLLDALGMNVQYTHASGAELYTRQGRMILDCLSGYCVHNVGHNHPHVVSELVAELQSQSTSMIQSNVVEKAGSFGQHPLPRGRRQHFQGVLLRFGKRRD